MAIRTNEELMQSIRSILGEAPDDAGLELLGDVQDTLAARGDVKTAVAENEKKWRKKFADRFEGKNDNPPDPAEQRENAENKPEVLTYDSLFEEKK